MQRTKKIRYAVVGLGHIAQAAVLPGFKNARNSEVVAFVSDDAAKHRELGKRYKVEQHYSYDRYEDCLWSREIDAVYIALPNSMHAEFTIRAAKAGVHVLCEKPLAVTARDCEKMIAACEKNDVKLMTAYRLHFQKANVEAAALVQKGNIGEPQIFNSLFAMQVREGNIRVKKAYGGGSVYDIGIYCINAARYLFRADPLEVFAFSVSGVDQRFSEVDAFTSATMCFPGDRIASFTCSFASSDVSRYVVMGTKGILELDRAYEYAEGAELRLTVGGKEKKRSFSKHDQFGAEIEYFSNCIREDVKPEASGQEGLADVRIIEAIYNSAKTGKPVKLPQTGKRVWASRRQVITKPPVREPSLVNVQSPSRD